MTSTVPKTILVVEDDESLLKLLKESLTIAGFKVFTAADGFEALDVLNNVKPNLIITDLIMPKVNGIEFIKAVRTRFTGDQVPIVALTGVPEVIQAQAMSAGADHLIKKPVKLTTIRKTIQNLLS